MVSSWLTWSSNHWACPAYVGLNVKHLWKFYFRSCTSPSLLSVLHFSSDSATICHPYHDTWHFKRISFRSVWWSSMVRLYHCRSSEKLIRTKLCCNDLSASVISWLRSANKEMIPARNAIDAHEHDCVSVTSWYHPSWKHSRSAHAHYTLLDMIDALSLCVAPTSSSHLGTPIVNNTPHLARHASHPRAGIISWSVYLSHINVKIVI